MIRPPRWPRHALLIVTALIATGCPKRPVPPAREQALVIHAETEPVHLTSLLQPDAWAHRISMHNLYESLVRLDPRTLGYVGELASSWQVSKDGRTYLFRLRPGVRWHDGRPLTGEDVKLTLDRVLDERVRATSARASLEPHLQSYRLVPEGGVEIVCKEPSPFFLVAISDLPILPAHLLRQGDLNVHPLLRRPVGTGPFRFLSWDPGRQVVLQRFEEYWGTRPRIGRLIYRFVASPDLALKLARRGELDFLSRLRPAQLSALRSDPVLSRGYAVTRHFPPGTSYIMLNHRHPHFADVRVRRAMARLLDLPTITGKIMQGLATPVGALYWLKDPDYNQSLTPVPFDPAGAKRLLAEAGFRDAKGSGVLERGGRPFRFTFHHVAGSETLRLWLTMYQQELRKAGITVDISPIDWAAFVDRIRKHDFDAGALAMQQSGPFTDLYYQFHSSQTEDGQNYALYRNPRVDRLLERIRTEMDGQARRRLSLEVQRLLSEDMAVIPLFALEDAGIVAKRVHGVYASALWYQVRDWWLE